MRVANRRPPRLLVAHRLVAIVPRLEGGHDRARRRCARVRRFAGAQRLIEEATLRSSTLPPFATGLHQVDNPSSIVKAISCDYSGTRGQQVPVSIFRVRPNGTRETFSSGIVTRRRWRSIRRAALRVEPIRRHGVPRGARRIDRKRLPATLASPAGSRSTRTARCLSAIGRTIFRVDTSGRARTFASLPASVAAFHLASARPCAVRRRPDLVVVRSLYRIDPDGTVTTTYSGLAGPRVGVESAGIAVRRGALPDRAGCIASAARRA